MIVTCMTIVSEWLLYQDYTRSCFNLLLKYPEVPSTLTNFEYYKKDLTVLNDENSYEFHLSLLFTLPSKLTKVLWDMWLVQEKFQNLEL